MKIYYFGELIEENGRKITNALEAETKKAQEIAQLELSFADTEPAPEPKKTGMDSIGDILKELDLSLDIYRPLQKVLQ
ncbi:MAG TPA: hypothetical protein PKD20_01865 [Candidatus Saccharibacteria bacterium]|jgi:hypothetical protein|nr:hypothetical protein [Candidatus Saccharibacteria bacterium]HMT55605.1 hypothetical protein [Candidatus Saccharibacteria bacterium]